MKKAKRVEVKNTGSLSDENIRKELKENRLLPIWEENKEEWMDLPSGRVMITSIVPPDGRVTTPNTKIVIKEDRTIKKKSSVRLEKSLIPGDEACEMINLLFKRLEGDMENLEIFPSVILITGPSGVGKTQVLRKAKEVAEGNGFQTTYFTGDELCLRYVGTTSDLIKKHKESIKDSNHLFIVDEVDIIGSSRLKYNQNTHMLESNVSLNTLLDKIDELNAVALLTSNLSDNLDHSIKDRCFEIKFKKPTERQIRRSVELWGKQYGLKERDIQELKQMEFNSYRESKKFCRLKALGILKELDVKELEVKRCYTYIR